MKLWTSDKIKLPEKEYLAFSEFLQRLANRVSVGYQRYGTIKPEAKYMSRLTEELKVYKKTGNMEQLLNIAVYAFLESYAPENKKFHFDANVDSATRSTFGGSRM